MFWFRTLHAHTISRYMNQASQADPSLISSDVGGWHFHVLVPSQGLQKSHIFPT